MDRSIKKKQNENLHRTNNRVKTTTINQLFIRDFLIIRKKTFGPENQWTFEKLLNISGDNRDRVHLNVHQHSFVDNNNNNECV